MYFVAASMILMAFIRFEVLPLVIAVFYCETSIFGPTQYGPNRKVFLTTPEITSKSSVYVV